jgi:arsenical pump membrane protein
VTIARIVLLVAAVGGAVLRPLRLPAFVAPAVGSLVALLAGLTSWSAAGRALAPLASPLGFLLAAIPLAVMLERYGYFEQVAALFGSGRRLLPGLWVLGAGTVAVMNLDAAVVLLTPLYLRIARQQGRSELYLGFQPVILALVASSFLPVSNLTNLIAIEKLGIGPLAVLEHLGLPSLAACAVAYFCYRAARHVADPALRANGEAGADGLIAGARLEHQPARDARVLAIGSIVVALLLAGFLAGPEVGISAWEVALVADGVLMLITRRVPLGSIPWATALVAAGLAILAAAAASGLHLQGAFAGSGPLAELRQSGVAAGLANVIDNLPALLVSLPFLGAHAGSAHAPPTGAGHAVCSLWPVLLGVNIGPSLLITGALASLLWFDAMHRLGARVSAGQYLRMGLRVGVPAGLAALAVLIALAPVVGCG